jgi:hypothetical protein
MENSYLQTVRQREFARSEECDLYLHIGHFFVWYNAAEFSLTLIIAMVMRERDLAAFHAVTKGLDAQTKIRRLRLICKIKKQHIGPNFSSRLKHFHDKVCDFRNTISHNAIVLGNPSENFFINSLDRMAWRELGIADAPEPPARSIKG